MVKTALQKKLEEQWPEMVDILKSDNDIDKIGSENGVLSLTTENSGKETRPGDSVSAKV